MRKLSIEEVKKIPPSILLKLIDKSKELLKKNNVMKDICKEFDADINDIDLIPIRFGELDVSARTAKGIITLNYKLLCDGEFFNNLHYIVHEVSHFYQQCYGDSATRGADDGDYLSNPSESDAFQYQLKYLDDTYGKEEAEKYVEHLLDHHDKEGKERSNLKEVLLEKVDD